jgi:hypothetical protein
MASTISILIPTYIEHEYLGPKCGLVPIAKRMRLRSYGHTVSLVGHESSGRHTRKKNGMKATSNSIRVCKPSECGAQAGRRLAAKQAPPSPTEAVRTEQTAKQSVALKSKRVMS